MPNKTVLHDLHLATGGKVVDFHGWALPVQFEGVLSEHKHTRQAVSVFDTSHMGQFLLQGPDIARELSSICTQNAELLKVGRCRYGFLLNEQGGVIDDTILMRLGELEFLLVVNAGTLEADHKWLVSHLPEDARLLDLSGDGWAKVDLQGPQSFAVLAPIVDFDLATLGYFGVTRGKCLERDCIISRTGYTGELGYEIMAAGEDLLAIATHLIEQPNVKPAGLGARDSLRLEMCYPLYSQELDTDHTPLEAGLDYFIPDNHEYIGLVELGLQKEAGLERKLVVFTAATRRRPNPGNKILCEGKEVGVVTSGAFAPSLEVSVGMGYINADLAEVGRELQIDTGRAQMPVVVVDKPLYKEGTCRTKDLVSS